MEKFFTPTRRYRNLWKESDDADPFEYTEVELAVPVEEFLSYRWDWKDLCAFVSSDGLRKFLWITDTENAFLVVDEERGVVFRDQSPKVRMAAVFQETSGQERTLMLMQDADSKHPTGAINVFWHAVTTSNSVKLTIQDCQYRPGGLPSGPILSQFLRRSPLLQILHIHSFDFKEEHCRALATLQRHNIEIKLRCCKLYPKNAEGTFIEWFRHNQVVTELDRCDMDSSIISALSGNHSVKRLSFNYIEEEEIRSLAQALPGNMGIEHLTLRKFRTSDEIWNLFFRSMSRHPRLEYLTIPNSRYYRPQILSAASKTARMHAVLQMLRYNTVVQTIDLADHFRDVEVYLNSILPRLEMNQTYFEVQRQAVKRADPSIRPQLLGRALHVVRYNPNLVFQFLSENVPAFVRTEEEEEEEEDTAISLQNDPIVVSGQKRKAP
jgi:hypothetical protein